MGLGVGEGGGEGEGEGEGGVRRGRGRGRARVRTRLASLPLVPRLPERPRQLRARVCCGRDVLSGCGLALAQHVLV